MLIEEWSYLFDVPSSFVSIKLEFSIRSKNTMPFRFAESNFVLSVSALPKSAFVKIVLEKSESLICALWKEVPSPCEPWNFVLCMFTSSKSAFVKIVR